MIQSGVFLGKLLGPLLKTGLPLIKNVIKPLAKSVLIPLGLTTAASAADSGIHEKILGSGHRHSFSLTLRSPLRKAPHNNTTLITSSNDVEDLIKIVKSLEYSDLLLKGFTETVQNEIKEQKGGFFSMLSGKLGASLLGNLLTARGAAKSKSHKQEINKKGKGAVAKSVSKKTKSESQGRGVIRAGEGVIKSKRQGKGVIRAGYGRPSSKNDKLDF